MKFLKKDLKEIMSVSNFRLIKIILTGCYAAFAAVFLTSIHAQSSHGKSSLMSSVSTVEPPQIRRPGGASAIGGGKVEDIGDVDTERSADDVRDYVRQHLDQLSQSPRVS